MPAGKARNGQKTKPETIEAKERAAQALELRKEGRTFADIAKECGYNSTQAAFDAVKRAIDAITREPAEAVLALELERLDTLWGIQYLNAQSGDPQALAACMKILDRRARYLGLDAPTKIAETEADGSAKVEQPTVINLVPVRPASKADAAG